MPLTVVRSVQRMRFGCPQGSFAAHHARHAVRASRADAEPFYFAISRSVDPSRQLQSMSALPISVSASADRSTICLPLEIQAPHGGHT